MRFNTFLEFKMYNFYLVKGLSHLYSLVSITNVQFLYLSVNWFLAFIIFWSIGYVTSICSMVLSVYLVLGLSLFQGLGIVAMIEFKIHHTCIIQIVSPLYNVVFIADKEIRIWH